MEGLKSNVNGTRYKEKEYTEKELDLAIHAVKSGFVGVRIASKIYGIPYTTLQRKVRNDDTQLHRPGPKPALGVCNERELVKCIASFQESGQPLTKDEIYRLALSINENAFPRGFPSDGWFNRFMKRHKLSLSAQQSTPIADIRDSLFDMIEEVEVVHKQ